MKCETKWFIWTIFPWTVSWNTNQFPERTSAYHVLCVHFCNVTNARISDAFNGRSAFSNFKRTGKNLPCCAKWQSASSIWRLIGDASLLAFCTIHGSTPSSIKRDLPFLVPAQLSANVMLHVSIMDKERLWNFQHGKTILGYIVHYIIVWQAEQTKYRQT
jgi:hypothetical protein